MALFLIIGAVIFLLDRWTTEDVDRIVVRQADVGRLADQWQAQMGRAATARELDGLVDSFIREEILVREAQKLGLDQNDVIIRRRMAQKLTFVTEDLAVLEPATEAALREYFLNNQAKYETPPTVTFSHIYFSPDLRDHPRTDASEAVGHITTDNWRAAGDPFMLRRTYAHVSPAYIRKDFGADFATALDALSGPGWQGPVQSGYGSHLVRIEGRTASRLPTFEEIESRLRSDYDAQRRADANTAYFEALKAQYIVDYES